jgi:hypothetical protein
MYAETRVARVDRQTVALLQLLARGLFYAAALVLLLSLIAGIQALTSDAQLGVVPELESEGRTAAAVFAVGAGITGAGILAGLGGLILLLLSERGPDERR